MVAWSSWARTKRSNQPRNPLTFAHEGSNTKDRRPGSFTRKGWENRAFYVRLASSLKLGDQGEPRAIGQAGHCRALEGTSQLVGLAGSGGVAVGARGISHRAVK